MDYRSKKLLSSRIRRILRWEFWPLWAFYPPIVIWICLLAIRYRSATIFTAVNPGMKVSGLVDDNKGSNLLAIQEHYPESVATTCLINNINGNDPAQQALVAMDNNGLSYPVILKPNNGQRGIGVEVINNKENLIDYFRRYPNIEILLQEHIGGLEFGVFYMREPDQSSGSIFSINEKKFPVLTGDGISTLEHLILANPRTHYMASYLLDAHENQLARILSHGESLQLVDIGSHCRGSIFTEGSQYITPELEKRIDEISKAIPGYYFGRYDLRVPNEADLSAGLNLKILEANGVSSESANIYDPSYGLFHAYKVMFKQWSAAFRIGAKNKALGHTEASVRDLLKSYSNINKE